MSGQKSSLGLRLLIAYDGRPFRGWQSQTSGDAVQDHLEAAFQKIVGRRIVLHGSGRTDAGVHALGQVAHVEVPVGLLPIEKWSSALNANLPPAIRVLSITRARKDFHARFSARGKVYTYRIWNDQVLHPLELGRVWHVYPPLDLEALRHHAHLLVGTHDFASFAARRSKPDENTVRTIQSIRIIRRGPLITFRFEGNGFLYKMVRLLTGTLVRCGLHRMDTEKLKAFLSEPGHEKTHFSAPAEGLYLTRVLYGRSAILPGSRFTRRR